MRGTKKPAALPVRSAMKTARPVPSRPPTAFVTGSRRSTRTTPTTTDSPTATAAAVSSPASALTTTNATGPRPVSTIARRSRSRSSGLGGPSGLGGRKHQVVEQVRREPALEQPPVDALEQQVAVVGVLDPWDRDALGVGARLERAVEPAEPVGQQLLAADLHGGEPGRARLALEVGRDERVHVDLRLEVVVVAGRRRVAVQVRRDGRADGAAP